MTTMNQHSSSRDQHRFMTNEWWSIKTNRSVLWKQFLFQKISVSWELEYWFYWMAYFMEPQLENIIMTLEKAPTKDVRYLDQIQQMAAYVKDVLYKCRCVLTARRTHCFGTCVEFPCQFYSNRFKCALPSSWHSIQVEGLMMCENAKYALEEDVGEVLKAFLVEWLREYYYVWKMARQQRIHFSVAVEDTQPMPLSDIRLWEVVCEDDDRQILSHGLLPHPSDFLEKRMADKTSTLYVDKARFEYEIPGTLSQYPVVLSHQRSIIPRMAPTLHREEEPIVCGLEKRTPQVLYSESTTAHRNGRQHKKRRLSKILKEGRKKNKTRWTDRRRAKNPIRQMFPMEEGEDYEGCYNDDDYDDSSSKTYSEYDPYEYEYYRYIYRHLGDADEVYW